MGPLDMTMWSGFPEFLANQPKDKGILFLPNHTSLCDPPTVDFALTCLGLKPYYMATAGLWQIPVINLVFIFGNFVKVHRNSSRAGAVVDIGTDLINSGKNVVMYPEGHIPKKEDSGDYEPVSIKTGAARIYNNTGCSVVTIGQTGARKVSSGGRIKQVAGGATARIRSPQRCVYVGEPMRGEPSGDIRRDTERIKASLTSSWQVAIDRRIELTSK